MRDKLIIKYVRSHVYLKIIYVPIYNTHKRMNRFLKATNI